MDTFLYLFNSLFVISLKKTFNVFTITYFNALQQVSDLTHNHELHVDLLRA